MLPDRVSNPGPLTYESGALPIALPGPAVHKRYTSIQHRNSVVHMSLQHHTVLCDVEADS